MKFNTSIVLSVVLGATTFALGEPDFSLERTLENFHKDVKIGHSLQHRRTEFSEACMSETEVLMENEELAEAFENMGMACIDYLDIDGNRITWDLASCPSVDSVNSACTAAGGKIIVVPSVSMACSMEGQSFSILMSGSPDCIGQSCDQSQVDNEGAVREAEQELKSMGMSCKIGNPASTVALNTLLVVGGAAALLLPSLLM